MLTLRPYPLKHARAWIRATHRRLPSLAGGMWCVGAWDDLGALRGVAVVGRPKARMLDVRAGEPIEVLEVLRVAVLEGTPNACSALYGACARMARAAGASGIFTYIHDDESGVSLRAAGWIEDKKTKGGEWTRPSRGRRAATDPQPKRRFWAPWSEAVRTEVAA